VCDSICTCSLYMFPIHVPYTTRPISGSLRERLYVHSDAWVRKGGARGVGISLGREERAQDTLCASPILFQSRTQPPPAHGSTHRSYPPRLYHTLNRHTYLRCSVIKQQEVCTPHRGQTPPTNAPRRPPPPGLDMAGTAGQKEQAAARPA
jgi:hypothetical protein